MNYYFGRTSIFFAFLFIFYSTAAKAQQTSLDSLEQELKTLPKLTNTKNRDTLRIICLNELSIFYKNSGKYAEGLALEQEVINAFAKRKDSLSDREKWHLATAHSCAGLIYFRKGSYDTSLVHQELALRLRTEIKDKKTIAVTLSNIGILYDNQGDYPTALKYHFRALTNREAIADTKGIAASCGNIGEVYRKQKEYDKAIEYYNRSLQSAKSATSTEPDDLGNKQVMGNAYNNIALVYESKNEFDSCLRYHQLALKIRTDMGDKKAIAASYNNIGLIYKKQNQLDTAMIWFSKSLEIKKSIGDKKGMGASYLNISGIFVLQKKYAEAEKYLKTSLEFATEVGSAELKLEGLLSLSQLYASTNRKGIAYDCYTEYISLRDSLENEKSIKSQLREEMNYTYGKKHLADSIQSEAKIKLEELQHEAAFAKQKAFTILGVVGFVLMLIVAGISFRAYRNKQKANQIISHQKLLVEEKQKEILDSIHYAKRIQKSLLPTEIFIDKTITRLKK